MKDTAQSSSVFVDIDSLTLSYKDGKKVQISGNGNNKLLVNVFQSDSNNMSLKESVIKHYKSTDSIPELSEMCGFNCTKTFSRHFIKTFETTPKQWILDMKEKEMIQLLRETKHSYERVSTMMKFKNLSHFNNFCKKRTGKTPSEIRGSV